MIKRMILNRLQRRNKNNICYDFIKSLSIFSKNFVKLVGKLKKTATVL